MNTAELARRLKIIKALGSDPENAINSALQDKAITDEQATILKAGI